MGVIAVQQWCWLWRIPYEASIADTLTVSVYSFMLRVYGSSR